MFEDRCKECELLNYSNTYKCPDCGSDTDMILDGSGWAWLCKKCDHVVVTTAYSNCYWDLKNIPDSCYSLLDVCPWAERKESDKEYDRICRKLGFIPSEYKTDICVEDDNWVNPFSALTFDEQDYLYYNGYLERF